MGGDQITSSEWHLAYDLATDEEKIERIQQASLTTPGFGSPVEPALFGSPQWWALVDEGRLPEQSADGVIERVYWGSMGDWPSSHFAISPDERAPGLGRAISGATSRECAPRVDYVELERQPGAITADLDPVHQTVVKIWVAESRVRGPAIAPGAGAVG